MNHQQPDASSSFVDFDCTTPTMQALILDYLENHTGVTFIDLEDDVPGFLGELTLRASSNSSTILWRGISSSGIHALRQLERQGEIRFREASSRIYQDKGKRLQLPVAKWHSPVLHWNPVYVELNSARPVSAVEH